MAKSTKKASSRSKALIIKAKEPIKSAPKAPAKKPSGMQRILTAEGWKRLMMKDVKKGKKG